MESRIMLVDDEEDFLDTLKRVLGRAGYRNVVVFSHPRQAWEFTERQPVDVALIDISMPEISGLELLEHIKSLCPETECIMVSGLEEIELAVSAMRLGAYDYLVKPLSQDKLFISLSRALERKRLLGLIDLQKQQRLEGFANPDAFREIVTVSPVMLRLLKEAELHARSDAPVLITGESGTGKELLARAIHRASFRADKPFVAVNMASISPTLFESEFFGHVRGAFTGADRDREGYLEAAAGGTLFLDEIGDLSLELQGKLLRVLQEKEFARLGTSRVRRLEVRFVAATNTDLGNMVQQGKFRKDLYYRLKVAWLHIPPLRERLEDVRPLVEHFLQELGRGAGRDSIQDEALEMLCSYTYPGNVRELRSILQAAANLSQGGPITPAHLPPEVRKRSGAASKGLAAAGEGRLLAGGLRTLAEVEREYILQVYQETNFNKTQTAKILGIGLTTLHRKLREYGRE